ncbi:MAG: hypothetical protein RL662_422 [Bacteroidota bacterium]|jgi:TolA-binding protein
MKVKLLSLFLFIASLGTTNGQKGINHELPNRLFREGKDMFLDKNYVGAQNTLSEFKQIASDKQLVSEADYMIAASSYFKGSGHAIEVLHDYLEKYPETYHRNDIAFYIGSVHFGNKNWDKAFFWFNQSDIDYLSKNDQEDYTFRAAYVNLQKNNRNDAARQFESLAKNSNKYFEAATYYKAYIDFREGKYDTALKIFDRLKNNPEYSEQSLFFITQGMFLKKDLSGAVNTGKNYLNKYPTNSNSAEIHRILGNSYYRMGNTQQSISSYEQYMALERKPFREDMFQLGTSYSQLGNTNKAIQALQHTASKDDKLGQAAYMLLGQNYLKVSDNANALMAFDAASRVKYDPTISEVALYNYAMLVHKTSLSVFDQSITVLQRFLNEYPNSKYVNEINNQLAGTLLSTNNYQAALNAIGQIRNPGKQILDAKQTLLFQLGAQDFIDGKYELASQHFNACINMGEYDTKSRNEAYFWRGETHYRTNNYMSAIKDYETYVAKSNAYSQNYADALYNMGYSQFHLKQYNNALHSLRQYTTLEKNKQRPTYSDALNRMGDCYLYNRNFADAERAYAQAGSSTNQGAEYADFQRAFVQGLQKNFSGKIGALDAMMSKYPNSQYVDDALFEKSRALVMLNREQDAIPVLKQLLQQHPNSNIAPQAGVLLGQAYYNTNNSTGAISAYKGVVQAHKNTEEAQMAIQSLEGVYRDMNDVAAYANYVNSLGGGIVVTASRQDSLTYLAAENAYMKGRPTEAINAMNSYLKSYPNGRFAGDAHFYIGSIAYDGKDYTTALTEFNKTISTGSSKNLNKALALTADIQMNKGSWQDAFNTYKQLDRVAVSNDDKTTALVGILKTANALHGSKEVIASATQLLASEKTSPEIQSLALLYRAKAYLKSSETNKAIADLQKVATDTRSIYGAEAQYILAETYYKTKSYDKAEQQVNGFMKQNTPHAYWMARAIIVLSDTYAAKGDTFRAKQYLESLKANYTGTEDDIAATIASRLTALNK